MNDKLNLHQKLVEIRKNITGFSKDTKGFGYDYVSGSQVLRAIKDKMNELGVLLIPNIDYSTMNWQTYNYITSKGEEKTDFIVTMKMTYTWVNAEFPDDRIICNWVCMGQQADDISKAVGTAMTYNERYFLLKFLGLPTDEDDADAKPVTGSNKWTNSSLTDKQINRLYKIAYSKGIKREKVDEQILKSFNKKVKDLTKTEYDNACKGYENMK